MAHNQSVSVAAVVLAAGQSSRMGTAHKLLAEFDGIPLVRRSALLAARCAFCSIVVVTGHRHREIAEALGGLTLDIVCNENYRSGMATSLSVGVSRARIYNPDGVLILLADMPLLNVRDLDAMIASFVAHGGQRIVRATADGAPGNPVIFPSFVYADLEKLTGDVGARRIIRDCSQPVVDVEIGDAARIDIDTPEDAIAAGGVLRG